VAVRLKQVGHFRQTGQQMLCSDTWWLQCKLMRLSRHLACGLRMLQSANIAQTNRA